MAEHYVGSAVAVYWGTNVDLSAYARSVEISETAPAPDAADTTHKSDSVKSDIQLLPGAPETTVNVDECVALGAALHAGLTMKRENPTWLFARLELETCWLWGICFPNNAESGTMKSLVK